MSQRVPNATALLCVATAIAVVQRAPAAQAPGAPTYYKDVLPILQKNCESCHRPGQIAPMSFQTYETARPWARAIKNAVQSKKMPPWFADPAYGHFLNDRSLPSGDVDVLARWADGAAPAGDPKAAPPAVTWPTGGWQIQPDLIVDGPKYDVPAKGIVEWTWFIVPGNFKEDTWVTSVEVKPSELAVTHHICIAYFNWQLWYDTSLKVPRGTKMRVFAWYDNSPGNKFNPNPQATVFYGDQTWEEMHFPSYGLVVDDITLTHRDVVAPGGYVGGASLLGGAP